MLLALGRRRVARSLERCRGRELTYPEIGATSAELPRGYRVDRAETVVGTDFERARTAIRQWGMMRFPGIGVALPDAPIAPGEVQGVLLGRPPVLLLPVRIVYVVEEPDRFGFAYGTLPGHVETGEERFLVRRAGGVVTYEILAFSRPAWLPARLAFPVGRMLQAWFRRQSGAAMRRAVSG